MVPSWFSLLVSPFLLVEWSPITWTIHSSPPGGYLGCFQVLKIMNKPDKTRTGEVLFRLSFQFIWVNTKKGGCRAEGKVMVTGKLPSGEAAPVCIPAGSGQELC